WTLSTFFFQAEDGIRDATVTGVQTCALPILGNGPDQAAVNAIGLEEDQRTLHGSHPFPGAGAEGRPPGLWNFPTILRNARGGGKIGRASCRKECRVRRWWRTEKRRG